LIPTRVYTNPVSSKKTPATANPGVITGVRGNLCGVKVATF